MRKRNRGRNSDNTTPTTTTTTTTTSTTNNNNNNKTNICYHAYHDYHYEMVFLRYTIIIITFTVKQIINQYIRTYK